MTLLAEWLWSFPGTVATAAGTQFSWKAVLAVLGAIFALAVYGAWRNGAFLRCPHCRKIGLWNYVSGGPDVVEKDQDGNLVSWEQLRLCRSCGKKVLHRWSDNNGRTVEKVADSK